MSRRSNGNNAFALAHGNRLASDSTHGVICANRSCRIFDPNISQKYEGKWMCERHGGESRSVYGKVKDADLGTSLPGAERRERLARFRNKGKTTASRVSAPLDFGGCVSDRKTISIKAAKAKIAKTAKPTARAAAMALLGLTEADIVKAQESN
jgi:hypothetical protein